MSDWSPERDDVGGGRGRGSASYRPPPPPPPAGTRGGGFSSGRGRASTAPGSRRPRPPIEDALIVPIGGKDVGKLIGAKGANIKELRSQSGCEINVGGESKEDRRYYYYYYVCK